MYPRLAGLVALTTLLISCYAVDLGPVSLHKTRCLSSRFKDCEECYIKRKLAMCHRLSLGKFHQLVAWTENRTDEIASAKEIVTEACDYLMDKEVDTNSITCVGFKDLFVNEGSGLETGGSDMANAQGALDICVKVFVKQNFSCALASVSIIEDANGNNFGITITVTLSITCQAPRSVFDLALNNLRGRANFSTVFVDAAELDFNPTGDSMVTIPFFRPPASSGPISSG